MHGLSHMTMFNIIFKNFTSGDPKLSQNIREMQEIPWPKAIECPPK